MESCRVWLLRPAPLWEQHASRFLHVVAAPELRSSLWLSDVPGAVPWPPCVDRAPLEGHLGLRLLVTADGLPTADGI